MVFQQFQLFSVKFNEPSNILKKFFETKLKLSSAFKYCEKEIFFTDAEILDPSLDCDKFHYI